VVPSCALRSLVLRLSFAFFGLLAAIWFVALWDGADLFLVGPMRRAVAVIFLVALIWLLMDVRRRMRRWY
jgi:hypothetical protein